MAMVAKCERCGEPPKNITTGPFAGQSGTHDYCEFCSKDLCDKCLKEGTCRESKDGKHHTESEAEVEA